MLKKALVSLMVLSTLGLVGCNSQNAYSNYDQVSSTSQGSSTGALAGAAVAGAATAGVGTVVGAAVGGGGAGAIVGSQYDKEEAKLKQELRRAGVRVIDNPNDAANDIKLVMPSNIQFAYNSAELSPRFKSLLNAVAKVINKYKFTAAEVKGFADSIGSDRYNRLLSKLRAQAVADYLVSRGVEPKRVIVAAYGESKPAASNKTKRGRMLNRRVEITLHAVPIR